MENLRERALFWWSYSLSDFDKETLVYEKYRDLFPPEPIYCNDLSEKDIVLLYQKEQELPDDMMRTNPNMEFCISYKRAKQLNIVDEWLSWPLTEEVKMNKENPIVEAISLLQKSYKNLPDSELKSKIKDFINLVYYLNFNQKNNE